MKVYSIETYKGVTTIQDVESTKYKKYHSYWSPSDVFIDPVIVTMDGILTIRGKRHSYSYIGNQKNSSFPKPLKLDEVELDTIFYDDEDIMVQDKFKRNFPFFWKKTKVGEVKYMNIGYYLNKKGIDNEIVTSIFKCDYKNK